jgi:pimeloyl-ACP methyl ester carboxylesterase
MPEFATGEPSGPGVIYYEELRPADPQGDVLLLHNFMSTGRIAWGVVADELAKTYRVILPDLPGHGRSVGYPPGFDHRMMAAQIAALVQALGITSPHVAGASSGGMVAAWLVQDALLTPATLTLVSSTYSVNPATTGIAVDMDPASFRAARHWLTATAKLHDEHQGADYFDTVLLPGFRALTPATALDLPLAALHDWRLPVCLIHGAEDEIFPVALAEQMHAALPDNELHVVPDESHALILRRPRRVGDLLRAFLARHPRARSIE